MARIDPLPPGPEIPPAVQAHRRQAPVEYLPTDPIAVDPEVEDAPALCLSGGGYRAMLFHLGSIWRLYELDYLRPLRRISSVSGGSITAGLLALKWYSLMATHPGDRPVFERELVHPLRKLASRWIDVPAFLLGVWWPGTSARIVAGHYRTVFKNHTLGDLPDEPRFVFNTTNTQSGVLCRFSKPYMADWRVGEVAAAAGATRLPLATVVAASSAFPPFISPLILRWRVSQFTPGSGYDLRGPEYRRCMILTDGGVYDNLGLETVWKRYGTVLCSDASGTNPGLPNPGVSFLSQAIRAAGLTYAQAVARRKAQLLDSYRLNRRGAYWGTASDAGRYHCSQPLPCPIEATAKLAAVPTRLCPFPPVLQERLINWGYAICDLAMRSWLLPNAPEPTAFPYPDSGVG
ncbi:MAG TPA: patatin-like phospholipase family protein [bacterium]|nr:patatin-like phospholipase family protein [bacterium]